MNVLLAVDQSRHSLAAARWVQGLHLPAGSVLSLLHVFELQQWPELPLFGDVQQFQEKLVPLRTKATAKARRFINRMAESFRGQRLEVQANVVEGLPGGEILAAIAQHPIDLVVVGTKGLSGIKQFLLGSVSEWVLSDAHCSVLMVRGQPRWTGRKARNMRVLLATDGSRDSKRAVTLLKNLNLPKAADLTIIHVVRGHPTLTTAAWLTGHMDATQLAEDMKRTLEQAGKQLLQETQQALSKKKLGVDILLTHGHAAEEILKTAKRSRADLIVVGSKGLTGLRRFLLGSTSHKVARHAPCSVLVVR